MADRFATCIRALMDAVLNSPGQTSTSFRQAVQNRAGGPPRRTAEPALADRVAKRPDLPPAVAAYVDKVALHAYKVTDADIEALKRAGYSEDAIFEITVSAAVAAGLARFERGRDALLHPEEVW
jgi:alkylhydroperoxidase family enzyme